METLLQYFTDYGYLVVFLATLVEGEVVLIVGGLLVHEGYLNFSILVLIATAACTVGDNFFYWLGRSRRTGQKHPRAAGLLNFIGENRLFKGEEFVQRHGGKWVFLIRFFYGLRYAGAISAGYFGMRFVRFFFFNLLGSLTWAILISGIGYLFGRSLEALTRGMRLAQIGLLLVMAGLLAIYLINLRRRKKMTKQPSLGGQA